MKPYALKILKAMTQGIPAEMTKLQRDIEEFLLNLALPKPQSYSEQRQWDSSRFIM